MKIGFLITARLKSSRLKRKILLDLNDTTILDHVIRRAKKVSGIDGVVLCTSKNPQDSELYKYALSNEIQFYIGSEDDVLDRLYSAARYYGYDAFLSITADNPLHSFYYGSVIIDLVKKSNFDFLFPKGLPLGVVPYYIKTNALDVAIQMKKHADTEIWGPFVNRPDFFHICNLIIKNDRLKESVRLTCDYNEDYHLLRMIYRNFDKDFIPSIFDVEDFIDNNKDVLDLNKSLKQIVPSKEILSKIKENFDREIKEGIKIIRENNYNILPGETTINI